MNVRFIFSGERKKLLAEMQEKFGIEELNYLLIESGKEKIRAFSGSLSKEEILKIGAVARIELVGLYLARQDKMAGLRLSMDALHLLKGQITKRVIEINKDEFEIWIRGGDVDLSEEIERGVYALRYDGDFVGCGFSNGKKVFNYVPRERQIKKPLS